MDTQPELAQDEVSAETSKPTPSVQFDIFDIILSVTGVAVLFGFYNAFGAFQRTYLSALGSWWLVFLAPALLLGCSILPLIRRLWRSTQLLREPGVWWLLYSAATMFARYLLVLALLAANTTSTTVFVLFPNVIGIVSLILAAFWNRKLWRAFFVSLIFFNVWNLLAQVMILNSYFPRGPASTISIVVMYLVYLSCGLTFLLALWSDRKNRVSLSWMHWIGIGHVFTVVIVYAAGLLHSFLAI